MSSLNLVIFGITSNLSKIKLIPALYDLAAANLLPEDIKIVGIARSPKTQEELRAHFSEVLHSDNKHHQHDIDPTIFEKLASSLSYLDGHIEDPNFYPKLKQFLATLHPDNSQVNTIYYLATYPNLYQFIFENLSLNGMNQENTGWVRLMIEKPIGNDLASARSLNHLLLQHFKEDQIYRLDHYLGKETLRNILTFRFANHTFEHLINKDHIDHIQITATEDFGIGDRGGYYDQVGALKDVGQNHQLQMLAFSLMEQPADLSNQAITKERLKVLQNLIPDPSKIVYGQYQGYTTEPNISPNSQTDTFYAFKTELNTDRFKGVPIYVRGGKKLKTTVTEISIIFKPNPNSPFTDASSPNVLIYRIQPNEGIVLKIFTKKSGHTQELEETYMQYCYKDYGMLTDPYEKLIGDVMTGDQTFFNDAAEVEAQWSFVDPLAAQRTTPAPYEPGAWGPKEAEDLIQADGRQWLEPSMLFCKI